MTPWLAIVNPRAGGRRVDARWRAVARALRDAHIDVDTRTTTDAGHGELLAIEALRAGHRRLLIVGGDGSAHDVINGVMNAGLAPTDRVTLALAPLGTGNDWARSLGLGATPGLIAAALARTRTVPHDVGLLEFDANGAATGIRRWFINVAGAGFDADVLERMPRAGGTRLAYLRATLAALGAYTPARMRLTDDGWTDEAEMLAVFFANGAYCGAGMCVAPGAEPGDGLLDLVAIRDPGFAGVLRRLPKLYDGRILGDDAVRHRRCARLRLSAVPEAPVEADGQLVGRTPVTVSVLARAVDVVTSA